MPASPLQHPAGSADAGSTDAGLGEPDRALLLGAAQTALLFDDSPGCLFVVKDAQGRYVSFNASLSRRVGAECLRSLQGRLATDIWPLPLAQRYEAQDDWVRQYRAPLLHQLDPILLPDRSPGWCITHKFPLHARDDQLVGILCLSRDVVGLARRDSEQHLTLAVDRMTKHCEARQPVAELAALAGLSPERFANLIRRIYGMSPVGFVLRNRIRQACLRLRGSKESLLDVALAAGFYDQAQFSRQFKRVMGMVPSSYRQTRPSEHQGLWRWDGML
jgi:AraC-like DNA-binding protein